MTAKKQYVRNGTQCQISQTLAKSSEMAHTIRRPTSLSQISCHT